MGEHRVHLEAEGQWGVTAKFTCTHPEDAWCRLACKERCDAWGEGVKCEHEMVPSGECGILPWFENASWDETLAEKHVLYDGPISIEVEGPDIVQWSIPSDVEAPELPSP